MTQRIIHLIAFVFLAQLFADAFHVAGYSADAAAAVVTDQACGESDDGQGTAPLAPTNQVPPKKRRRSGGSRRRREGAPGEDHVIPHRARGGSSGGATQLDDVGEQVSIDTLPVDADGEVSAA